MQRSDGDITQLLAEGRAGDVGAQNKAMRLVYDSISQIARQLLRRESAMLTLSAPELVNEAFLRLFGDRQPDWESRRQLLGYAARTMRQILVSMARRRDAEKRPQRADRMRLTDAEGIAGADIDIDRFDSLLERLEALDERQVRIVEMKFFAGMTIAEIAESLDVSTATIVREWRLAKAWLKRELEQ